MIDVHLLRYALAAAETGSFSRAAGRFRVKQATLSKRIRDLELRLGLSLFERSTRGVAPTPMGDRFLARARTILGDLEALSTESESLAKGNVGRLRVGFQGTLAAGDLRAVLDAYRDTCPGVEIEYSEGERHTLLTQIDRDRVDLAILAGAVGDAGRRSLCLWSEPLIIGMAQGHPLAARDPLYWTDLRGASFLVTAADPGPLIAAMIQARLSGQNAMPRIVSQAVGRDNLLSLASEECVTATVGMSGLAGTGMLYRSVHDAFGPTRIDQGLHWREDNPSPALREFLKLIAKRHGRSAGEITG